MFPGRVWSVRAFIGVRHKEGHYSPLRGKCFQPMKKHGQDGHATARRWSRCVGDPSQVVGRAHLARAPLGEYVAGRKVNFFLVASRT